MDKFYIFIKMGGCKGSIVWIHQVEYLSVVHFTICKLFLNKKIKLISNLMVAGGKMGGQNN